MRELSLFSGAGGGLLGTKLLGWECLGYVEFNDYCQRVLQARIKDGIFDDAPIFGDIRAFIDQGYADSYQGMVDVVTAGFPCQPFSVAGKQQGEDDERNMWPATIDVIRRVRPRFALLENVPGLLAHPYAKRIFGDLAESGFNVRWRVLSAAECGAPHKRDRVWIRCHAHEYGESVSSEYAGEASELPCDVPHTKRAERRRGDGGRVHSGGRQRAQPESASVQPEHGQAYADDVESVREVMADTISARQSNTERREKVAECNGERTAGHGSWWSVEPGMGRVANEFSDWLDFFGAVKA